MEWSGVERSVTVGVRVGAVEHHRVVEHVAAERVLVATAHSHAGAVHQLVLVLVLFVVVGLERVGQVHACARARTNSH